MKDQRALREMEKAIARNFPKILERKARAARAKKKVLANFSEISAGLRNEKLVQELRLKRPPAHQWRVCPAGHSWVKTHKRSVNPTPKNPDGFTMVDGHCRINRSQKEVMYFDEINRIAEWHFKDLDGKPCPISLGHRYGTSFDELITGWTQYWNEVFPSNEPLTTNWVKALIGSESGFRPSIVIPVPKRKGIMARGLMQVTDETLKILSSFGGEIKDHFVILTRKEILNPSANIHAGIRWLFHKRNLASSKLGRPASWDETLIFYKGYASDFKRDPTFKVPGTFYGYLKKLQECQA